MVDGNFGSNKSNLYYFSIEICIKFGLDSMGDQAS